MGRLRKYINRQHGRICGIVIITLLCSYIALPQCIPACAATAQDEIASSREKIIANEARMQELKSQRSDMDLALERLEKLRLDASAYITELDDQLSELDSQITGLNNQIADTEAEIEITAVELADAAQDEKEQYEAMKLRIKYMYERGNRGILSELLDSGSLRDFLNKAEYIQNVSEYDRTKLDEYVLVREQKEAKEAELRSEYELLSETEELLSEQYAEVEELEQKKQAELASYNAQIAEAQSDIAQMNADISGIQSAIAQEESNIAAIEARIKAEEEAARRAAEASGSSYQTKTIGDISFIWPCPASSTISSYFGDRESPTEGASTNHKGIDISAPTGSAVLAAASGEVVIATYSSSAGNYIMISHGGGVYTVYMHMSSMAVSYGDSVSKGQTIGAVGSTGYSTGPHLHFGVRIDGSYVNPLGYVSP